jgi:hypothetical protein
LKINDCEKIQRDASFNGQSCFRRVVWSHQHIVEKSAKKISSQSMFLKQSRIFFNRSIQFNKYTIIFNQHFSSTATTTTKNMTDNFKTTIIDAKNGNNSLDFACELLKNNELVAFPTETVYGLGANALSKDAVDKIFKAKGLEIVFILKLKYFFIFYLNIIIVILLCTKTNYRKTF